MSTRRRRGRRKKKVLSETAEIPSDLSEEKAYFNFQELPLEIQYEILDYLEAKDLEGFRRSSKFYSDFGQKLQEKRRQKYIQSKHPWMTFALSNKEDFRNFGEKSLMELFPSVRFQYENREDPIPRGTIINEGFEPEVWQKSLNSYLNEIQLAAFYVYYLINKGDVQVVPYEFFDYDELKWMVANQINTLLYNTREYNLGWNNIKDIVEIAGNKHVAEEMSIEEWAELISHRFKNKEEIIELLDKVEKRNNLNRQMNKEIFKNDIHILLEGILNEENVNFLNDDHLRLLIRSFGYLPDEKRNLQQQALVAQHEFLSIFQDLTNFVGQTIFFDDYLY